MTAASSNCSLKLRKHSIVCIGFFGGLNDRNVAKGDPSRSILVHKIKDQAVLDKVMRRLLPAFIIFLWRMKQQYWVFLMIGQNLTSLMIWPFAMQFMGRSRSKYGKLLKYCNNTLYSPCFMWLKYNLIMITMEIWRTV